MCKVTTYANPLTVCIRSRAISPRVGISEFDVTNFSPKTDAFGSRENLHLIERWTRTGPTTLVYEATVEDPTVWTRPWTVSKRCELPRPPRG
jgi:hypothetical protein